MVKDLITSLDLPKAYETFLEDKKQKGFSFTDHLQSRYYLLLESHTLKDKVKNFILGGVGYFFTPPLRNGHDLTLFKMKAQFCLSYHQIIKLYQHSLKEQNPSYLQIKHLFETVHQKANEINCSANCSQLTHQIFEQATALFTTETIEEKLIFHWIQEQLFEQGKLNIEKVVSFFSSYSAQMNRLIEKGYGSYPTKEKKQQANIHLLIVRACCHLMRKEAVNEKIYRSVIEALQSQQVFGAKDQEEEKRLLNQNSHLVTVLTELYLDGSCTSLTAWRRFVRKPFI
ncbi:MAG: hypothetical protein QRY72_01715 [Candidatus Rhabdochlamydia sp.]